MPCCPKCGYDWIAGVDEFFVDRVGGSHSSDPSTSLNAAVLNYPRSGSQRERVLLKLIEFDSTGATFEQLQVATGIESAAKRLTELVQGGWAIQTKATRKTHTGARAVVHIASEKALAEVDAQRRAETSRTAGEGKGDLSSRASDRASSPGQPAVQADAASPADHEPVALFGDEPTKRSSTSHYSDVEAA